jgi:hypothetical protein
VTDWSADAAAWATAVGTGAAAVAALYIANRGWREAAAQRREDRWERNVLDLGELLTSQVGESIYKVRLEQSLFRPLACRA